MRDRTTHNPPSDTLTGHEFEDLIVPRLNAMRSEGSASISRYGVHATVERRLPDGKVIARLIPSQPDFEGVFGRYATQTMFDAKVCSQAAFDLNKYRPEANGARSRQLTHMYERASYGCPCFFLIHWNGRKLKTRFDPPVTYAMPVHREHPFWEAFDSGMEKALKRSHCQAYAEPVQWTTWGSERIPRPDIYGSIEGVQRRVKEMLTVIV
jgi:penicillin-binding protein-related factor A (putative recombinase)